MKLWNCKHVDLFVRIYKYLVKKLISNGCGNASHNIESSNKDCNQLSDVFLCYIYYCLQSLCFLIVCLSFCLLVFINPFSIRIKDFVKVVYHDGVDTSTWEININLLHFLKESMWHKKCRMEAGYCWRSYGDL